MSTNEGGSVHLWGILKEKIGMLAETRQMEEAVRLTERLVEVGRRAFGVSAPAVVESLELLGDLLAASGRLEEAESPYREAFDLFAEGDPKDLPGLIRVGFSLAGLSADLGRNSEAARIYSTILPMAESLEECDPRVLANLHSRFAVTLNALGKDTRAESHYRKALDAYRAIEGKGAPIVALLLDHLGAFYLSRERFSDSVEAYGNALEIRRALPEADSASLAQSCGNLAVAYHSAGQWELAEKHYREAIERIGFEETGTLSPEDLGTVRNYAALLLARGRKREAEVLERAIARATFLER